MSFVFLFLSRFVNFRDNPLTLDVTLPCRKMKAEDDEDDDDREMFGREFMKIYIQEARKRSYAVLNMHCINREYQHFTALDSQLPNIKGLGYQSDDH